MNRTSKVNDIALLLLEENPKMQSRIDDDSDPHKAIPTKFCPKERVQIMLLILRRGKGVEREIIFGQCGHIIIQSTTTP